MKLYKYVSPERIDILLNAEIRFSQAEVWNDQFELQPYYQDHIDKTPFEQLSVFAKFINDFSANGVLPTKEQLDSFENERNRFTKDDIYRYMNKKLVGLSLTEERENLLMWSHYTGNHTGFVIELNTDTDFFKSTDRYLHKIDYGIERPKVKTNEFAILIIDLVNLMTEKKEIPEKLLKEFSNSFKKGLDWSYEKEWRLITITEKAENFKSFEQNLNTIYIGSDYFEKLHVALFPLPPETISSIYVGGRAPKSLKRKLYLLTKHNSLYSHIKLLNTSIDDKEFKLNYKEAGAWDILTGGELNIEIDKTTKWQRLCNPYINRYYREIMSIKKIKPNINKDFASGGQK